MRAFRIVFQAAEMRVDMGTLPENNVGHAHKLFEWEDCRDECKRTAVPDASLPGVGE